MLSYFNSYNFSKGVRPIGHVNKLKPVDWLYVVQVYSENSNNELITFTYVYNTYTYIAMKYFIINLVKNMQQSKIHVA